MGELLLEILSEEIPARMRIQAADTLKCLVCEELRERGFTFTDAREFSTPRRLTLVVNGIPEYAEDQIEERRGPRVGAPEQAIQGFLKATGLSSLEQAEKRRTDKGTFWFSVQRIPGAPAVSSVVGAVESAFERMSWPKSMRWADHRTTWVRPIRSI